MRRFLRRVRWSRVGCAALGAVALALAMKLRVRGEERGRLEARLADLEQLRSTELRELRHELARTRAELREKELLLHMAGSEPRLLLHRQALVPAIGGVVVAVQTDVDPQLVLLSVGSDDGVEKGFHFSIYRGSRFVGKVVVEKVLRDSAGCRVLFTAEGHDVRPGDSAATRLL